MGENIGLVPTLKVEIDPVLQEIHAGPRQRLPAEGAGAVSVTGTPAWAAGRPRTMQPTMIAANSPQPIVHSVACSLSPIWGSISTG